MSALTNLIAPATNLPATDLAANTSGAEAVTLSVLEGLVPANGDLVWLLVLVPVVALGYVWAARRRQMALTSLGNPTLVTRLCDSVHRGNRLTLAVLTVLTSLCMVLGLMRLQYGGRAEIVPASGLDIVLVVDYSKSMLAKDVYPSRSERLEAELSRFLDSAQRRGDRVGLVVFAGLARGLPVSRDMRLLKLYLQKADPRTEQPGGTAIGRALRLAIKYLKDARAQGSGPQTAAEEIGAPPSVITGEADQVIIVMTDGEDTDSKPLETADEATELGIQIFTFGIGSTSGEPIQKFDENGQPDGYQKDPEGNFIMTRVDEPLLQELSKKTGGQYLHADAENFGLDEVTAWLADLSRAQREDTVEIHRDEGFPFVVFPALLLLTLSLTLGERRRHP